MLMGVRVKKEKAAPPNLSCSNGFYDDTWSAITKIEFVLVVSSTMAEVRLPQRDSRKDVLRIVFVMVILEL